MKIGDKAPEILGRDENGQEIKMSDFKGKKLVLYFYPKDSTPGCTYMGTIRTTFIIDENGVVEDVIGPKQIKVKEHAEQILG